MKIFRTKSNFAWFIAGLCLPLTLILSIVVVLGFFGTESGEIHWATVRLSNMQDEEYVLEISGFNLAEGEPVKDLIVCNRRNGAEFYALSTVKPELRDLQLFRTGGELLLVESEAGAFRAYRLTKGDLIAEELLQLPEDAREIPLVVPVVSVQAQGGSR